MSVRWLCLAGFWLAGAAVGSCAGDDPGGEGASGGHAAHTHGATGGSGGNATGGGGALVGGMGGEDSGSDVCGPESGGSVGTGATPTGRLDGCYGPCPNGQCDSSDSFFEPGCAGLYPCSVDSDFPFCTADGAAAYCLMTGEAPDQAYWLVACDEGNAVFELCATGCSAADGETYACL